MDDAFAVTEVQNAGEVQILPMQQAELEKFLEADGEATAFDVSRKILHDLLLEKAKHSFELELQLAQQADDFRREKRSFYLKLLIVMDSIDRILKAADPDNELVESVEVIQREYSAVLEDEQVSPIDLQAGHPFDPATCESVSRQLRPDLPQNTIIQIQRRGYNWQDKVLRKARVIISKQG